MQAEFKAHGAVQGGNVEVGARAQDATNAAGLANFSCANLAKNISVPFATSALYVLRTLEIGDKNVVMRIDADGFVLKREVHLPPAVHPANAAPTSLGHSIGHWEGKALVIDTVAFSPGRGQSVRKHLIERLALTEDRHQVRYEVTVEDPDNYPKPFHYEMLWDPRPDLAMSGAACDDQIARKFLSVK